MENKRRTWLNILLVVIVFGLFAAMAWYYFSQYDRFNRQNLEAFIGGFGAWAPIIYIIVYAVSSPIPFLAPVLSAAGGLLFGTLWGMLLVVGSATLSATIPFFLARMLGREWVEQRVKGSKIEKFYEQSEGSTGFIFIMLMRLIPVLPWEVQNYAAGLTQVSLPIFAAGTIVGILPGSFSLVFLGASATDPTSWEFFLAIGLKIVTALIPILGVYIRSRGNKEDESQE
ncbi:MAG: TVP38/TMEM64 family protein [Anaerolineae bacterium]